MQTLAVIIADMSLVFNTKGPLKRVKGTFACFLSYLPDVMFVPKI